MRLGHACNSSSSHSIVVLDPDRLADMPGQDEYDDSWGDGACLGSDLFELASEEAKLGYIVHLLRKQILEKPGDEASAESLIDVLLSNRPKPIEVDHIDHQSEFGFPTNNVGQIHPEFIKELFDFVSKENIRIIGGSDEVYYEPSEGKKGYLHEELGEFVFGGGFKARKDSDGHQSWWTLFRPWSGNKVRFSFRNPVVFTRWDETEEKYVATNTSVYPRKSLVPELVDMKITDYCAFEKDCGFCYMNSGKNGEHGKIQDIKNYLFGLGKMSVFEVALGGGETTLHPDFLEILQFGREQGINMNFTTKNFAWFLQKNRAEWRKEVAKHSSAIAFSVNNPKDLERLEKILSNKEILQQLQGTALTMQCIPAILSKQFFRKVLLLSKEHGIRLTLLGFKRTGRGREFETKARNTQWVDILSEMYTQGDLPKWFVSSMAVDTVMAQDCRDEFDRMRVSPVFYHTEEGAFSCFIDAVKKNLAASSFCEETLELPKFIWKDNAKDSILETYEQMQGQLGI